TEKNDLEDQRMALISDALSLESQISARIEAERQRLKELASKVDALQTSHDRFAALPEVQQGLHRFWLSITWLDASNRIVVQLPEGIRSSEAQLPKGPPTGLSAHLSVTTTSGATLVARYSPSDMLRQGVPWWLARKYDVRLVDSFGAVIASTAEGKELPHRQSYRVSLSPTLSDSYLELIARDRVKPWYQSLSVLLAAGFVALIAISTWMLRRQMDDVARAEEAWRTEAAWRGAMEDSLTVGLRARDLEGRLLYVNKTLADMIGYKPEELIGLMPPMPYWPAASHEEIMTRHRRTMAGEAPSEGYEAVWRHRDGRDIQVMIFEARLVDAHGKHIGWMGSTLDITERKRAEERERHQIETMTHQARLTMLGEVASALAHELNQPLTAIASYNAGVINSLRRAGHDDATVLRALQRLGEQARHAGQVVQRIREFLTRRSPQRERCELQNIARHTLQMLKREVQRHQVAVELSLRPDLPAVWADPVLIEQVVINLVRNAIDELGTVVPPPEGGRQVSLSLTRSGEGYVRLDVCDNGRGLGGLDVDRLCAPFYSTKSEGMGMGLAICRSILEAHHGVLDAGAAPGGGARFSFALPVYRAPGSGAETTSASPSPEESLQ
ncbi:MAG TPA: PAS domain S-box protein, partial [Methylibium sp.]